MVNTVDILTTLKVMVGEELTEEELKVLLAYAEEQERTQPIKGSDTTETINNIRKVWDK